MECFPTQNAEDECSSDGTIQPPIDPQWERRRSDSEDSPEELLDNPDDVPLLYGFPESNDRGPKRRRRHRRRERARFIWEGIDFGYWKRLVLSCVPWVRTCGYERVDKIR